MRQARASREKEEHSMRLPFERIRDAYRNRDTETAQYHRFDDALDDTLMARQIAQVVRQIDDALGRKDINGLLRNLAKGFQEMDLDGTLSGPSEIARSLGAVFPHLRSVRWQTQIQKVSPITEQTDYIEGSTSRAEVLSVEHVEETFLSGETGKLVLLVIDQSWHGIWVRENGAWRLFRNLCLARTVTQDGVVLSTATATDSDERQGRSQTLGPTTTTHDERV